WNFMLKKYNTNARQQDLAEAAFRCILRIYKTLWKRITMKSGSCCMKIIFSTIIISGVFCDAADDPLTTSPLSIVTAQQYIGFPTLKTISSTHHLENPVMSPLATICIYSMLSNLTDGKLNECFVYSMPLQEILSSELHQLLNAQLKEIFPEDSAVNFDVCIHICPAGNGSLSSHVKKLLRAFYQAGPFTISFETDNASCLHLENQFQHPSKISTRSANSNSLKIGLYMHINVHFDAEWSLAFDATSTRLEVFHLENGKDISVPMMQQNGYYLYSSDTLLETITLPFGNGEYAMILILPRFSQTPESILSQMTPEYWNQYLSQRRRMNATIKLPRFSLSADKDLTQLLTKQDCLKSSTSCHADDQPTPEHMIDVLGVTQNIRMTIAESGRYPPSKSEIDPRMETLPYHKDMVFDRPFLWAVRHEETGSIVLLGQINNPLKE
ncbi:hypothetical protein JW979_13355, partial [bacterium]|nr:hypothetical protein [candidate division CSSED10-310 bacterium]